MEYLSTTSLASELDIPINELFSKLKSLGWINRKNEKWVLTEMGKQKGGQTRSNSKYGAYIVWPENIQIDQSKVNKDRTLLNSTAIGEHFKISNQRMNLILSELGWIEKDVSGWRITKLGQVFSGKQMEHDTSGVKYVLWPQEILTNKHLVKVLNTSAEAPAFEKENTVSKVLESNTIVPDQQLSFREKYEAKYRTIDGHYVRSISEMLIDNWLYQCGLIHAYERKLPIEEDVYCDFYIPSGNGRPQAVYIEFWGLENDTKYVERKRIKIGIYKREGLALIELNDTDIKNLDDVLPKKLIYYKIKVG